MRQVSWRRWGRGWTKTNRKWANSNSALRLFQRSAQLSISFISQNIDLAGASAPPASQPPTHPEVRGRRGDIGMVGKPQLGDFTCEMWHFCVEKLRSESFFQLRGKTRKRRLQHFARPSRLQQHQSAQSAWDQGKEGPKVRCSVHSGPHGGAVSFHDGEFYCLHWNQNGSSAM